MACNFDPNICTVSCKKYTVCSYYSMQCQINNIQSQLNFIYTTITEILKSSANSEAKIKLLEKTVQDKKHKSSSSEMIVLQDRKGVHDNEKEN